MPESQRLSGGLTEEAVEEESEHLGASPATAGSPLRPGLLSCGETQGQHTTTQLLLRINTFTAYLGLNK